jgi:hypothetical protein
MRETMTAPMSPLSRQSADRQNGSASKVVGVFNGEDDDYGCAAAPNRVSARLPRRATLLNIVEYCDDAMTFLRFEIH